jgi:hypothetical protein
MGHAPGQRIVVENLSRSLGECSTRDHDLATSAWLGELKTSYKAQDSVLTAHLVCCLAVPCSGGSTRACLSLLQPASPRPPCLQTTMLPHPSAPSALVSVP